MHPVLKITLILNFLDTFSVGVIEDMHQEEAPISQLSWHPGEHLSYAAKLKIKKAKTKNKEKITTY